jgi:hypothetical protein
MYLDGESGTTTFHAVRPESKSGSGLSSAPHWPVGPMQLADEIKEAARRIDNIETPKPSIY